MRLSRIKLAGFKSFVDPTTVTLASQRVGIVGPNGCGKSNVIDAVRWVMGESSARNLRGDAMTDVIFNGSSARKPVGQASIELIFDNSEGRAGGQYAQYGEISVRRQLNRDGQSIYALNGSRCRRRDITDLFLGTGLGPRSYAIIEQGTISRLIEARPEELRVFLEEAAGISKYKERRRETENRIRHTRENLERLTDLREEVERQLVHLQRQAKTAERYRELKEEERRIEAQLLVLRLRELEQTHAAHARGQAEQETALEARMAEQRHTEAALEAGREAQVVAADHFSSVQGQFYAVGADIARLEQSIQHHSEQRRQREREHAEARRQLDELHRHLAEDRDKQATLEAALAEDRPQLEVARQDEAEAAQQLHEAEEQLHGWQREWEAFQAEHGRHTRTVELERAALARWVQEQAQLEQRRQRLEAERDRLVAGDDDARLAELGEARAEAALEIEAVGASNAAATEQLAQAREVMRDARERLDQLREQLQLQRGRHASLEALQQAALRRGEGVAAWLEREGVAGAPQLATLLDVEPGWEAAVECVLGPTLEAVCLDGVGGWLERAAALEEGRLALVDTAAAAVDHAGSLAQWVRAPWSLDGLLTGIHAVETLDEARARLPQLGAGESLVTRDGVWLGHGWLRVARAEEAGAGVLQREQALRELNIALAQLQSEEAEQARRFETARVAVEEAEQVLERGRRCLAELEREDAEQRARESALRSRLEQVAERRRAVLHELDELALHWQQGETTAAEARERLAEAECEQDAGQTRREALEAERERGRGQIVELRDRQRAARAEVEALALRVQAASSGIENIRRALDRLAGQEAGLRERCEELALLLEEGEAPDQQLRHELDELLEQRQRVEQRLGEAREQVEASDRQLRELEQQRSRIEQQVQAQRGELEQARLHAEALRVRAGTVREQLEAAGVVPQVVLAELPAEADEPQWRARLERVRTQIERLGAINLAAIDEYAEQSRRKAYLDAQDVDLNQALETLEGAIRRIDRETRGRFRETFDRVNAGLQALFPRLFGGGAAWLELTGEDLLDTGVTVMARPPGKRNSTIHLLSGGEKALTAVALVFAIFRLNPAPFCMLDEVDAPLDDANVGRFCELVREMSEQIQFIFITHNKTTMELADHLMGVTMSEPGVSRLVAVDVEAAAEWVAA